MSSIDQQFVEFVVKSIVSNPDSVQIERTIDEKGVLLELTVSPDDLGRVIGKKGATAQSIRTLLRALGTKNEARYNLKIVDNGEPRPERTERTERRESSENSGGWGDATSSSETTEVAEATQSTEQPAEELKAEVAEEAPAESSSYDKTRAELAELDDLDV
ncbi:MAG: KH domain-containing protein [Patescibacteria group bacterium]